VVTRQEQVLDAAVTVLGTQGSRQLTHRAVDAEAGVPSGSTSNYFRTRGALIAGVLERLIALERAAWNELAAELGQSEPLGLDRFADAVGKLVGELSGARRVITLARLAVFAEAATHPQLRQPIESVRTGLEGWGAEWISKLGSPRPIPDFWGLMALIDGLLLSQCATPAADFDPVPAIHTYLRGIHREHDARRHRRGDHDDGASADPRRR
jgi:DNA-binding transcriptional regulator YbjK